VSKGLSTAKKTARRRSRGDGGLRSRGPSCKPSGSGHQDSKPDAAPCRHRVPRRAPRRRRRERRRPVRRRSDGMHQSGRDEDRGPQPPSTLIIMPSGVWTDASGTAWAPFADSPKMKAKATSLFIGFSPRVAPRDHGRERDAVKSGRVNFLTSQVRFRVIASSSSIGK
jgi:hypothetical protein